MVLETVNFADDVHFSFEDHLAFLYVYVCMCVCVWITIDDAREKDRASED